MLTDQPQNQGEPRSGFHKRNGTTPWFGINLSVHHPSIDGIAPRFSLMQDYCFLYAAGGQINVSFYAPV